MVLETEEFINMFGNTNILRNKIFDLVDDVINAYGEELDKEFYFSCKFHKTSYETPLFKLLKRVAH